MFSVDYIEPAGQPKKAPFVLRTADQLSMFFKSESKSILLRVIQRIVQFEKGSVNILMEKDEKSCEVELSSTSTQSSASPNSKSSNDGVSKESTRTVIPSHSRKRQKVTRSQDPKRLSEIRGTQRQFSENICSEDDLRSRIFETFVVNFLARLPLLGF